MTTPQHLVALESANRTRISRAELRRTLSQLLPNTSIETFKVALDDPKPEWEGMLVYDLLRSVRRYGRARSLRALRHARIAEHTTIGKLTDRQRQALKEAL